MTATTTPTTAYSYVRFSSKGQSDSDSLRRQIDASRRYAAEQGWVLDEIYDTCEHVHCFTRATT